MYSAVHYELIYNFRLFAIRTQRSLSKVKLFTSGQRTSHQWRPIPFSTARTSTCIYPSDEWRMRHLHFCAIEQNELSQFIWRNESMMSLKLVRQNYFSAIADTQRQWLSRTKQFVLCEFPFPFDSVVVALGHNHTPTFKTITTKVFHSIRLIFVHFEFRQFSEWEGNAKWKKWQKFHSFIGRPSTMSPMQLLRFTLS